MASRHPKEHRRRGVVAARRWPSGGALTPIVWREGTDVVLSHEGAAVSTARLDAAQVAALLALIETAAR